ncbi:hypothetical protein IJ182_08535 [bacterium]|nr:hypothetical protein [bacterium]
MKIIIFIIFIFLFQIVYADVAVPPPPVVSAKYVCSEIKETTALFPFEDENGLYGFKNSKEEIIIEPQYKCDKLTFSTSSRRSPRRWYCCNHTSVFFVKLYSTILIGILLIFAAFCLLKKRR